MAVECQAVNLIIFLTVKGKIYNLHNCKMFILSSFLNHETIALFDAAPSNAYLLMVSSICMCFMFLCGLIIVCCSC